jgi:hypothetical protein
MSIALAGQLCVCVRVRVCVCKVMVGQAVDIAVGQSIPTETYVALLYRSEGLSVVEVCPSVGAKVW